MPNKPIRRAMRALKSGSKQRLIRQLRRWPALWQDERLDLWYEVLCRGEANPRVDWLGLVFRLGADVNQELDREGTRPLILVAARRRQTSLELARRLIAWGAKLDALNENGESALSYAANENFGSMVALLLEAGADPRAGRGEMVAPATARCWASPEVQALLERGLSEVERAQLPSPWKPRWHQDDMGVPEHEMIDVPDGKGGFAWIRNPFPGWLWIGPWPPTFLPPQAQSSWYQQGREEFFDRSGGYAWSDPGFYG